MGGRGASSGLGDNAPAAEWIRTNNNQGINIAAYFGALPKAVTDWMDEFPQLRGNTRDVASAEKLREQLNSLVIDRFSNAAGYIGSTSEMKEYLRSNTIREAQNGYDIGVSASKSVANLRADAEGYANYKSVMSNTDAKWWLAQKGKLKELARTIRKDTGYYSL